MFLTIRLKTFVQLHPEELNVEIEKTLMSKLKARYEGVCSRFGLIKPGSLRILQRSAGSFMKPHFNGHTRYEVLASGEACNPTQGMVVSARVKAKNNLGILAEAMMDVDGKMMPILDIIIPRRSAGIASEVDLEEVSIGADVFVEVLGKRYQLNDTKISIIGRIVKDINAKTMRASELILEDDAEPMTRAAAAAVPIVPGADDEGDEDGDLADDIETDDDDAKGSTTVDTAVATDAETLKLAALLKKGEVAEDDGEEDDEEEDDDFEDEEEEEDTEDEDDE